MYAKYKRLYFDRSLPRYTVGVMKKLVSPRDPLRGACVHEHEVILLKADSREAMASALLHEMIHVAVPDERAAHGPRFRAELKRLIAGGAPLLEDDLEYRAGGHDPDQDNRRTVSTGLRIGLEEGLPLHETLSALAKLIGMSPTEIRSVYSPEVEKYKCARRARLEGE